MSVKSEVCSVCGCRLVKGNRSIDARLCEFCFSTDLAELEDEDMLEDSMSDSERLAEFLG